MNVVITGRPAVDEKTRTYAEEKVQRLERHGLRLHDMRLLLSVEDNHVPANNAELIVHAHHKRLVARTTGQTLHEAIDLVMDKMDRQVVRQKEKITDHKAAVSEEPNSQASA